jgi:hypothetical protein
MRNEWGINRQTERQPYGGDHSYIYVDGKIASSNPGGS